VTEVQSDGAAPGEQADKDQARTPVFDG
jgi:hypothetical protein